MGRSRMPRSQGIDDVWVCTVMAPRTPGSLGIGDGADPTAWAWLGDTPGPLGIDDCAAPTFSTILETTLLAQRVLPAGGTTEPAADTDADLLKAQENPEL